MPDLNPGMEDLMRKAADAYPLREMDDRWDEIASQIGTAPAQGTKERFPYRSYLIMLLFLVLFLFTGNYLSYNIDHQATIVNKGMVHPVDGNGTIHENDSRGTSSEKANSLTKEESRQTNGENFLRATPLNKMSFENGHNSEANENEVLSDASVFGSTIRIRSKLYEIPFGNSISLKAHDLSFQMHNQPFFLPKEAKENSKMVHPGKFYYGATTGLSFNSVKQQNAHTGWSLGLLAGYQVKNRLSLETGVLLSQKHYWTAGNYFSMEKLAGSMPPPITIMEVDGETRVIELPLIAHYNLIQTRKRTFYSSAGFSSYILTKEYNQYHTSTNGNRQMMYGSYTNHQDYFAASLDLGIGYQQNLGRKTNIRFQPYMQLPLEGIGMGNLHVMSTGIRIALVRGN